VDDELLTDRPTLNLAQQGYRESTAGLDENPGNFKNVLELVI